MDAGRDKIGVWLDCDPGHDDVFAILLAAYHPSLNLLGISTVHGNAPLTHTTYNATSVLTAIGRSSIPVYPGAASGLVRPAVHASDIHGESGLDGTSLLPVPSVPHIDKPAVDAIAAALLATKPATAWLVATGALTNVAHLFERYPAVATHIKGLSIMGGAIGSSFTSAPLGLVESIPRIGNWSVWAEFNILVDPEAAQSLFSNPVLAPKTTLIPLDVTHLVLATKPVQELLLYGRGGGSGGKGKTRLRTMLVELLTFFAKTYVEVFGIVDGPPLHDPLAVAAILDGIAGVEIPFYDFQDGEEGRRERFHVHVVTEGSHEDAQKGAETGRTVVKLQPVGEEGVKIPRNLNVERFWAVLEECLVSADEINAARGAV